MAFKMNGFSGFKHVDMTKPANHKHEPKADPNDAGPGIGETKEEVAKANSLEDKNNNAAARKEYMEMMKAKKASPKKKSPLEKGADPASVTNRKNEGDKKGARIEKRRGNAAANKNTSRAKRLARNLRAHDNTDNRGKQPTETKSVSRGGKIQF